MLRYKKLHPDARIDPPVHPGDVGYDIYAVEEVSIPAGSNRSVPVGFALDIPDGYYVTVETRSGHGLNKGLRLHRGIIDQGFRGEMSVQVYNHGTSPYGSVGNTVSILPYIVKKGEKIGQLVLHKVEVLPLEETLVLSETSRGINKCGSTDKQ